MKYKFLKLSTFFSAAVIVLVFGACVKAKDSTFTDFSQISDFVILQNSGLGNFKASNVLVNTSSPDTVKLDVTAILASANSSNGPVTVTLGLNNAAIAAYNAANGTNFQPFPANAFKLVSNTITIEGGLSHYGSTKVWIFQNKLDPSVSYILPVSITDGGGKPLTTNQNTLYFNVIGNPLAGVYLHSFYRWNSPVTDTALPPNSTVFVNTPHVIPPITATTVLLPEDYLETFVGVGVNLTITNTNGVLSNPVVSLDAPSLAAILAGGFTIVVSPKLVGYNIVGTAATKYAGSSFRIYMQVINSSGGTRTVIDNFIKQ